MGHPICVVDAFTHEPFRGNPAAVCLLASEPDEGWMRRVAREMNLSETAFLVARDGGWSLRWFTPTVEVALCGHATLASAHVLHESHGVKDATFYTRESGELHTRHDGRRIEMNFPARPCQPAEPPPGLEAALGAKLCWTGRTSYDYLVELSSEEALRSLNPDHYSLSQLPVRGVIVTARAQRYDFVSRFFAPGSGVPEDPVTGSAHCSLAPFWSERLGKKVMSAFQASERGGELEVECLGERVLLRGQAVTTWRGELQV
jgi:predicted PhzF superfamily epimerase YddE/YHI9